MPAFKQVVEFSPVMLKTCLQPSCARQTEGAVRPLCYVKPWPKANVTGAGQGAEPCYVAVLHPLFAHGSTP